MYDWWMQHIPGIEIDDCSDSFRKTLKSAKLIVVAHNSTTLPETFSMNIPTLVSWKPEWVEIRDSAKPIFNKLEESVENKKVISEMEKMKNLIGYNRKTQ